MAQTQPIFILSCERSGSTLLRYILDSHPDIACPGELYLGQLATRLHETLSRTTALAKTSSAEKNARESYQETNRILTGILSEYAHLRGKKIWCEKTPDDLHHLEVIQKTFHDARYLCLYRNSLDVVQSCLERRQKLIFREWTAPYERRHPYNFAAAMLESWVAKTESMLAFEDQNPQTYRVRYEDLVTRPRETLDPLFQFLNLDWDPALLERVFSLPHDMGGGDEKILETRGIEKEHIGQGARIDPRLIALVPKDLQQRQERLHEKLGY